MDCEVFSYAVLREAYREATGVEREHVTMYIYRRPERYRMLNVAYERDESTHRWTIDTPEDYELIRRILEVLYPSKPDFTLEDCLALLEEHPEWSDLNRHVKQKSCEPGMPSQRQCGR
jgi:spore coat polysaccharide biosynthesis protein SpsF